MRLGISALLYNLDDALELCRQIKDINHIEIGLDNLDECIILQKYKGEFKRLGLSIGIHLPMELNSCENIKYIQKSWINFIRIMEENLSEFNIKYFNMHLGYVISERLNKNRIKYLDNSVEFLKKLLEEVNTKISIENTYSKDGDFSNIGYIYKDFEYIFNKIDNEKLCFCYDTGHCLINNSDYIGNLNDKLMVAHLSDNDGINDSHLGIGRGILKETEIQKLMNTNLKYLVLEINYNHIKETLGILSKIKRGV
ncbi:sugar phosphate isomerase/epimerase family protein [Romboutsia sp. 13368]|uniref:sugar phosphate isomerase/epimerase family protein n=1 Tax=Romboutsia sp. 13368 TaxID=2708053 RepID=UPI0025E99726|nr:sugar phosphate isomerase/epimerase [Romboutsia sp. 13368]